MSGTILPFPGGRPLVLTLVEAPTGEGKGRWAGGWRMRQIRTQRPGGAREWVKDPPEFPGERPGTALRRHFGHPGSRPYPGSPGDGRNPAPGPAPGRGPARPGGVVDGGGVSPTADQPDHPAVILRAGRASRRERSRSPRAGILSGRLPSPDQSHRAGGVADAEPEVRAGGVRGCLGHSLPNV